MLTPTMRIIQTETGCGHDIHRPLLVLAPWRKMNSPNQYLLEVPGDDSNEHYHIEAMLFKNVKRTISYLGGANVQFLALGGPQ